jgi:TonB family protein
MKAIFSVILLSATLACAAQNKIVGVAFLKYNGKYVTSKDSADFYRLVTEPDSGSRLFNVAEYYKDGKKKLVGRSSKIDPPEFEGQCISFYSSGKKQTLKNYKDNIESGTEYDFYPNGKIYRQLEYPDNGDRYSDMEGSYSIVANFDSTGTAQVTDGNGYYKGYDDKFKYIEEEGSVKNGQRDGEWKGNEKDFGVSYTENYKNGILVTGNSSDSAGTKIQYTRRAVPPEFKGGLDGFSQYLGRNINYPDDARSNNIQGKVIVSFVVEKDGKVTEVKVSRSVYPSVDAEAVRVLQNSPRWIPGKRFGRPVRVAYSVPVSFALTD